MHLYNAQLKWKDIKFFNVGRTIQLVSITVHVFIKLNKAYTQVLYSSLFICCYLMSDNSIQWVSAGEWHSYEHTTYLSVSCFSVAFAIFAKAIVSVVVSVRMEQFGSHGTDFI